MQQTYYAEAKGFWFDIWFADKESMLDTMVRNLAADLENGYDYFGKSATEQREQIAAYKKQFDEECDLLKSMTDEKHVDRWCYIDLKKRGAI